MKPTRVRPRDRLLLEPSMSNRRGGLGRGLDALLGLGVESDDDARGDELAQVPTELLQRGRYQPRTDMRPESLQELADSIRVQGMVQPILVRPLEGERLEIVAGERRWRAAQLAGLEAVPVIIRRIPDQAAMATALVENIQREDLNPLEEAMALRRLVDEFGLSHQEVATAVGRSRSAVTNLLRLLELAPVIQTLLRERQLEMGHARALLALAVDAQERCAREVMRRQLSVRETEKLVKRYLAGNAGRKPASRQDPDVRRLQDDLADRLGARVVLDHATSGRGRLVIHYTSVDELDGIINKIK